MIVSIAELFLAYRQAKISLHQEQQGPWKLAWAEAELPRRLEMLEKHLRTTPGWFDHLTLGRLWLRPKKAVTRPLANSVRHIGGTYDVPLPELSVRPHLSPSLEFSTIEVLWLSHFGAALESLLDESARGNRLELTASDTLLHIHGLGCFEFWPAAYEAFRAQGLAVARQLLTTGRQRCLLATFDLTHYYDEIAPSFLTETSFIATLSNASRARNIAFDDSEYLLATTTLLEAFERYRSQCQHLTGVKPLRGIPIGCLTSKVIANVALATLDTYIQSQPGIHYYARYVDDILIVAVPPRRIPSTSQAVARMYLLLLPSRSRVRDMHLDASALELPDCGFRLQSSKLKTYALRGRRGRDFVDTIERDITLIASERRTFILPDIPSADSPLRALFVGSDGNAPVQVLREVDRLRIERYAAGVAVSKALVGVELLDPPNSAKWCKRQLGPLLPTSRARTTGSSS